MIRFWLQLFICLMLSNPEILFADQTPENQEDQIRNRASQARVDGSFDLAIELYGKLLQLRIDTYGENSIQVAKALSSLGVTKINLGLFDDAIPLFEKSAFLFKEGAENLANLAATYHNLAICYLGGGDIEKARTYYENAERIYQKLQFTKKKEYETLLNSLANFSIENKKIAEAEKYNQKSFEINPHSLLNFNKLTTKGLIYFEKNEYHNSILFLKKAIAIGEKDKGVDFAEKGLIYLNLGMVYLKMGDFVNSVSNYQTAKFLIGKWMGTQNISYASSLKDLGLNYLRKKESESNLENFLALRKKNIHTALDYFQEALVAIAPGFNSKDWQFNPAGENSIDKTRLLEILRNKAETFHLLSQIEEKQGHNDLSIIQLKTSLVTFDLSIKTIQLIRKGFQNQESRLFLSENEHPVYEEAVEVAIRLYEKTGERYYFEKGFEFSERSRSANFQTMLRELQATKISELPDTLVQNEKKLKVEISAYENFIFNENSSPKPDQNKINQWKDKLFSLTQTYQQLINLVEKNYPRYYQYKYADPIVSIQKIQQSLNRREVFIEYFIRSGNENMESEVYSFVITDHEYKIIRKPIGSDFDATIDQFLSFIRNSSVLNTKKSDYVRYSHNANALYKLLIEPATTSMENYRLVIVPDDKLSYLPFDAFIATAADTTKMDFRNLDYLMHHHAISYTYSATLLFEYFQNDVKYSSKIGAFAPDYSDQPLAFGSTTDHLLPLPGAEAEVTGVTKLFSGDQFLKHDATKQKFLDDAGKYDILHLAMHTILNDTLPLYSKMVFSADTIKKSERTLNTFEVYNLKLKSDMVVLSGCSTGTGKLQKGEGVMSLARGFLFAGCPSIIMTLWNVEDVSSSVIMMEFYRNLKNGFSKDEALRRSKITYIAQADPLKAHPHFWLAYVSIGKQNPLFKTKAGYFVGLIIFVFLAIVLEKWYFKRKKR